MRVSLIAATLLLVAVLCGPLAVAQDEPVFDDGSTDTEFEAGVNGELVEDPFAYSEPYAEEIPIEPPRPIAPTDAKAARDAFDALKEQTDLQFERPEGVDPPEPPPLPEPRGLSPFLQWLANLFNGLGRGMAWLFYGACIAVVLGVVYFLFGEALRTRFFGEKKIKRGEETEAIVDLRPDAETARSLLEEADALARQGMFAEAVHLLLFRSIEDIQGRLASGVPKSLTAREIGVMNALPDRARAALSPIIRIVEASYFGGRAVDESGWQSARRSYDEFAFGAART